MLNRVLHRANRRFTKMELAPGSTRVRQNQENLCLRRRATISATAIILDLCVPCAAPVVDVSPNRRSYRAKLLSAALTYSRTPDGA